TKLTPSMFFILFFQAEDGIRDRTVTGVQTCALPISSNQGSSHGPPNRHLHVRAPADLFQDSVSQLARCLVHRESPSPAFRNRITTALISVPRQGWVAKTPFWRYHASPRIRGQNAEVSHEGTNSRRFVSLLAFYRRWGRRAKPRCPGQTSLGAGVHSSDAGKVRDGHGVLGR